jgi:hypothetical protein
METLMFLFIASVVVYLNRPAKKDPPKDLWCEMGKAIGKALQSLNKPESSDGGGGKKSSSPPPMNAILGFAIGATLLGSFGGLDPILQTSLRPSGLGPRSQPAQSDTPANPTPDRPAHGAPPDSFSIGVRNRLQVCLQSRLTELAGIPSLSGLLASVNGGWEANSDFDQQLMVLYSRAQQLRMAIESCDPALIQDIVAARQRLLKDEQVVVIRESASIREGPHETNAVIYQVPFGTILEIDYETLDLLSPQESAALLQEAGWIPVFLGGNNFSGNNRGFIKNSEARQVITPSY